jgi:F-type H+-transporting ATPase subunit epsilon
MAAAPSKLPTHLTLEVVTPEGLLLREQVDEVIAPGAQGYFGVRPGHTPFLTALGLGEISYRVGAAWGHLTCFWGFCEVLPDRVNLLAELGERAEAIDLPRAEAAMARAEAQLKAVRDEAGFQDAQLAYRRAVTRLAVARKRRPA